MVQGKCVSQEMLVCVLRTDSSRKDSEGSVHPELEALPPLAATLRPQRAEKERGAQGADVAKEGRMDPFSSGAAVDTSTEYYGLLA